MQPAPLDAETIRSHLLSRAEAYAERQGCSLSTIGEEAIRDGKFLLNVRNGANFTVKTYQRVIDWLDAAERGAAA